MFDVVWITLTLPHLLIQNQKRLNVGIRQSGTELPKLGTPTMELGLFRALLFSSVGGWSTTLISREWNKETNKLGTSFDWVCCLFLCVFECSFDYFWWFPLAMRTCQFIYDAATITKTKNRTKKQVQQILLRPLSKQPMFLPSSLLVCVLILGNPRNKTTLVCYSAKQFYLWVFHSKTTNGLQCSDDATLLANSHWFSLVSLV